MMLTISNLSKKCFGILIAALLCSLGSNAAEQNAQCVDQQAPKRICKVIKRAPNKNYEVLRQETKMFKEYNRDKVTTTITLKKDQEVKDWKVGTDTIQAYPCSKIAHFTQEQCWNSNKNCNTQEQDEKYLQVPSYTDNENQDCLQKSDCDTIKRVMNTTPALHTNCLADRNIVIEDYVDTETNTTYSIKVVRETENWVEGDDLNEELDAFDQNKNYQQLTW